MNELEMGFRTQIVGGFLRDDVLQYIEQANRSFTGKIEELERSLEQMRQNAEEQTARAEELTAQNNEFSAKDAELLERLGAMTLTEDGLRTELEGVRAELAAQTAAARRLSEEKQELEEVNAAYLAELEELRCKCREYELAKEHMAEIELRAYRQAKELEAQSREECARVKKEAAGILEQMRQQLRSTGDGYRLALGRAQEEFNDMYRRSRELLGELESAGEQLGKLRPKATEGTARQTITEVFNSIRGKEEK